MLIHDVSSHEVKDVLWSMDVNRALVPDGYNIHFFKVAWDVVGSSFVKAVQSLFASS